MLTPLRMVTLVRLAQALNATDPNVSDGARNRQTGQTVTLNAPLPMLVTLAGIVTLVRPVTAKAPSPMLVRLAGSRDAGQVDAVLKHKLWDVRTPLRKVALVKLPQYSNTPAAMVVTLPGIVTLVGRCERTQDLRLK